MIGVIVTLSKDNSSHFTQQFTFDPAQQTLIFPLQGASVIPDSLPAGVYDRRIEVFGANGVSVALHSDLMWIFGAEGDPESVVSRVITQPSTESVIDPGFAVVRIAQLEEFVPMEWSNTSLGCPQPDTAYAEVATRGFRIVYRVHGPTGPKYEYRTNEDASVVVGCSPTESGS